MNKESVAIAVAAALIVAGCQSAEAGPAGTTVTTATTTQGTTGTTAGANDVYATFVFLEIGEGVPPQISGARYPELAPAEREVEVVRRAIRNDGVVALPWLAVRARDVKLAAVNTAPEDDAEAAGDASYRIVVVLAPSGDDERRQLAGPPRRDAEPVERDIAAIARALATGGQVAVSWLTVDSRRVQLAYMFTDRG